MKKKKKEKLKEFKARWETDEKGEKHLVIEVQSEETERVDKDGKKHKDVVIHAPALPLVSGFVKDLIGGK